MLHSSVWKLAWLRQPRSEPCRLMSGAADSLLKGLTDFEKIGLPNKPSQQQPHRFDLGRMKRLLEGLGNPHQDLKVVHLAGSKGKGSVATMLASMLHNCGYNVGLYTSPHISSIRERISVQMSPIAENAFDDIAQQWTPKVMELQRLEHGALSHFEVLTALAFRHYADSQVDIAVVETGVGGTLDATNVFEKEQLELSIITPIGLEHQNLLGDTLEEIAAAKAGICRAGVPCIISTQVADREKIITEAVSAAGGVPSSPRDILEVESLGVSVQVNVPLQHLFVTIHAGPFSAESPSHSVADLRLLGVHQAENAGTALAAASHLREQGWTNIELRKCLKGLEKATLPGRFQVDLLQSGFWLVRDGAHTLESASALSRALQDVFPGKPVAFIIAMANDKDHAGVMKMLRLTRPGVVVFTEVPIAGDSTRSAPPGMLAGHWQAANFDEDSPFRCRELLQANMASAIRICERELSGFKTNGIICVTGSLHAVSAANSCLETSISLFDRPIV